MACTRKRLTAHVNEAASGKIIANAYGWPVWQKSGLGRRVQASTDLHRLCTPTDEGGECSCFFDHPSISTDWPRNSRLVDHTDSDTVTMPLLASSDSRADNYVARLPAGTTERQLRGEEPEDGPLYFVCKGKLITLPNEAEIDNNVGVCTESDTDRIPPRGAAEDVLDPERPVPKQRHTRTGKRRRTLLPLYSIFGYQGRRKKRKQRLQQQQRSNLSFTYVKAFGETQQDSAHSPVLAYATASKPAIQTVPEPEDPPSLRIIREKWREQADVQFQLRLLRQRHRQEGDQTPSKHSCNQEAAAGLQIIGGFDGIERYRKSRRGSYFDFIKYWNPSADLFWMKQRFLNWISKLACFSKVNTKPPE